MADGSKIEWTDATWNPITGCSVVSPGCTNCYAMKLAGTRMKSHHSRAGLTVDSKAGPVWNGQVRLNEAWLTQPLTWAKPRRIFVCAHGDLFHESVPDAWIDRVFAVMALCPQHTFQVLTKRAARIRAYFARLAVEVEQAQEEEALCPRRLDRAAEAFLPGHGGDILDETPWPLPNVWLGVSAEDQPRLDERVRQLQATPAAVRFLSLEPLLGEISLRWLAGANYGRERGSVGQYDGLAGLHWVIVGGESGPGARPMHPDWARQIRDECAAAGVPFFFKQWGEHLPATWDHGDDGWCYTVDEGCGPQDRLLGFDVGADLGRRVPIDDEHGSYIRVGKKIAGRLLDGVEHDDTPAPTP